MRAEVLRLSSSALLLTVLFSAAPAVARFDPCEDLWFTRNLLLHRAGYCFQSKLGASLFDNAYCTGDSPAVERAAQEIIAEVQRLEKLENCSVDAGRSKLDVPDMAWRRMMVDLPIAEGFESSCFGWREGIVALYGGRSTAAPVVARIEPGDDVIFYHRHEGGWSYVMAFYGGSQRLRGAGWRNFKSMTEASCKAMAG